MFKHRRLQYIVLFVLIMLSFTFATPTFACFAVYPTLEQAIDGSHYVFVGIIVETIVEEDNSLTLQIEVERYLQGKGLVVVYVTGFYQYIPDSRNGGYELDFEMSEGQSWVFFANGDGETLQSYPASRNYNKVYLAFDDLPDRVVLGYINDSMRPIYRLERQLEKCRFAAPLNDVQREISYWMQSISSTVLIVVALVLVDVLMVMLVVRRWIAYNHLSPTKRG